MHRDTPRYSHIFEFGPTPLFVVDGQGVILDVNRRGTELLGISEESLRGRTFADYFHEQEERLREVLTSPLPAAEAFEVLTAVETAEGRENVRLRFSWNPEQTAAERCFYVSVEILPYSEEKIEDLENGLFDAVDTEAEQVDEGSGGAQVNRDRLFRLLESIPFGFIKSEAISNAQGGVEDFVIKMVNDAFELHTGLSRKDVEGKAASSLIPEFRDVCVKFAGYFGAGESVWKYGPEESFFPSLNKWLELTAFGAGDKYFGVIVNDIGRRKEVEKALHESHKKLETMLVNLPVGIVVTDDDGRIREANTAAESILKISLTESGYEPEGGEWRLVDADMNPLPPREYPTRKAVRENRVVRAVVLGLITHAGGVEWLEITAAPLPVEGLGAVSVYANITHRRQVEKKYEEQAKLLESVINNIPHYICWRDAEFRYLGANKAYLESFGLQNMEQIRGKYPEELVGEESFLEYMEKSDRRVLESGESIINEVIPGPEVTPHVQYFSVSKIPLTGETGEAIGVINISTDITDIEKNKQELKESREQLRRLSRYIEHAREEEKMRIAGEIHDELGQALTALELNAVWLKRRFAEDAAITAKIDSMRELIQTTTDKVRQIAMELRPSILDDLGLTPALRWLCSELTKRSGISFHLHSEVPDTCFSRRIALEVFRIVQESVTNIIRHSQARSAVISLERNGEELVVAVRDTGIGIDIEQVDNSDSFGILGMRERAAFIGGSLDIRRGSAGGTVVELHIHEEHAVRSPLEAGMKRPQRG